MNLIHYIRIPILFYVTLRAFDVASVNVYEVDSIDSIIGLREVSVTSKRSAEATVQHIEGATLQGLSSTSIADALKYMAGVQIKDYGGLGGLKTLNVRSMGAQHVGVYVDGVRITNAQNGIVDLGKFSLSTLESVSLYNANRLEKCQSASEYASASTVYLRTRRPMSDSLSVTASAGSFHCYGARINCQLCKKLWSGMLDAEYGDTRGDYTFRYKSDYEDTVGRRKNSDIRYYRTEATLFYGGLSAHAYLYVSQRGCPGGIVRRLSDKYTNIGREWDTDAFIQTSWHKQLKRIHQIRFTAKYSYEYLRYRTDYPDNQNTARFDNHFHTHDAYTSGAYCISPLPWFYINSAYDLRLSWLSADLKHFSTIRRLDQKFAAGLNLNLRGFRGSTSLLYQHYKDHTFTTAGASRPIGKLTYAFNIACFLCGFTARAWYKTIFRVPTLNDLYYTQAGNRNLKPEDTRQFNIGLEYKHNKSGWNVDVSVDTYVNHITNRIVCLPLRGTYTWTMLNYGKTYCQGINANVSGQYAFKKWIFSLINSFTVQHDVNRTNPADADSYDIPICYSPKFSCGSTAIVKFKKYTVTVSNLYVGKRMWSYADSEDNLPPYNNVDIKLTAEWKMFSASLEINDLFDIQYEHVPRYPMPGRSLRFSLTYSL